MIVDSNIIIYAITLEGRWLPEFIVDQVPAVSATSYVEVLGYHRLSAQDREELKRIFRVLTILPIDQPVFDQAVDLRQQRKMGLGDALIAATALVYRRTLVTRNTADFAWAPGLMLLNPFDNNERRTAGGK